MEKDENNRMDETTDDVIAQELAGVTSDSAFVKEFLKAGFLSSSIDALFYARRRANLTQSQVAELMNTKQAAIARLEADTDGSFSLRRYIEFALACGMVPLNIVLAPVESVQNFIIAHPDSTLTQVNYDSWILAKETLSRLESQSMQSTSSLSQETITVAKSSIQGGTENNRQISYSGGSEEQTTINQYRGRLAA